MQGDDNFINNNNPNSNSNPNGKFTFKVVSFSEIIRMQLNKSTDLHSKFFQFLACFIMLAIQELTLAHEIHRKPHT